MTEFATCLCKWSNRKLRTLKFGIPFALLLAGHLATANSSQPLQRQVKASLVASQESINGTDPFWVALRLEINPEWHTYWINPGDSGSAISIDWKLPQKFSTQNKEMKTFTVGEMLWPNPEKIPVGPLMNYGYEGTIYLVAQVRPVIAARSSVLESIAHFIQRSRPNDEVILRANAKWLVCKEICIPESAEVELVLPVRPDEVANNQSAHAPAIEKVLRDQPKPLPVPIASPESHSLQPTKKPKGHEESSEAQKAENVLEHRFQAESPLGSKTIYLNFEKNPEFLKIFSPAESAYFFAQKDQGWDYAGKQLKIKEGLTIPLRRPREGEKNIPTAEISGWLELKSKNGRSDWYRLGQEPQYEAPLDAIELKENEKASQWEALFISLLAAFLGGLFLNLMPCVFPVLGIKVMHLVRYGSHSKQEIRKSTFYYLLGCLSTFWVLVLVLLILRSGGSHLGWGFQLQSPLFVLFLTLVLYAMALNLLGVFEVSASKVSNALENFRINSEKNRDPNPGKSSVKTLGENSEKMSDQISSNFSKESRFSSFLSGIITTIVATPCTAPFMGSAIAYALTRSSFETFLIFSFLGFGMAFPFLLLSYFPHLLRHLPKPGPWMDTLKKLFSFPLFLTCVWLAWVYSHLHNFSFSFKFLNSPLFHSIVWLSVFLIILGMNQRRQNGQRKQGRLLLAFFSLLPIGGALYFEIKNAPNSVPSSNVIEGSLWRKFEPSTIDRFRSEGFPVFVDFTADWCITCQVNKKVALDSSDVITAFKKKGVVLFRADWTKPDETITRALQGFGRNGVPLYIFYLPGEKEPRILPQILTPGIVLKQIEQLPSPMNSAPTGA